MRIPFLLLLTILAHPALADQAPRARDLGIPFDGKPGELNAITDVAGVTVGHVTLIEDLEDNRAVRTGVTAVLPRGAQSASAQVMAAWFSLNGNGEMTGTAWVEESGFLEGPVMITNTHSVGAVHEGTIRWRVSQGTSDHTGYFWSLPLVAETWDGYLNDINGFHVRPEHAIQAIGGASGGPVAEGAVGGGTGMICYDFKCGIGTASRVTTVRDAEYTIGVLVQANFGDFSLLRVAGVPVGHFLRGAGDSDSSPEFIREHSSIIIVVATDAPLLPGQLKRLARRATLGLGRNGSIASNGSGDIFVAFSTANEAAGRGDADAEISMIPNDDITPLFRATVEATEEAIINALVAGRDMRGHEGHVIRGIDHEQLKRVLREHNRLLESD